MDKNSIGTALLLLGPVAAAWLTGHTDAAKYVGIGCVLAALMGVIARPAAPFALLLPVVYAAAAVTAQYTYAAVALIVAIAAAVGAAGSMGLQRGLVALLGATLLGSCEPAPPEEALRNAGWMLVGSGYALVLVHTLLRRLRVPGLSVRPEAAVAYAMLLSVLTLVAWFAGRLSELPHAWWLPLAVIAVSEPVAARSPLHSTLRTAAVLCMTLVLVTFASLVDAPAARMLIAGALLLAAAWQTPRHPTVLALLLTPLLVLLAGPTDGATVPGGDLATVLMTCLPVFAATCICHFAFWTLRITPERSPA
jgi:hypothetical protein